MKKKCSKCNIEKNSFEFYKRSDKPHLLQSHCKDCLGAKRKEYRLNNLEKFKIKDKSYHIKNKERRNKYLKKWQQENKKDRNIKDKIKRQTDVHFLLRSRIHNRIRMAIKRNSKFSTSSDLLGCSLEFFKKYFMNKFRSDMKWNDFMTGGIHIDHIIPCAAFDLSKEEDQFRCFHYTNLQPLWALDNLIKSDSMEVTYR